MDHRQTRAFTLIELSIVLVIIGLIVSGILFGRELIAAAQVRAQISQLSSYSKAFRTFQNKYAALPGDINNPSYFGLSTHFQCNTGVFTSALGNGQIEDQNGYSLIRLTWCEPHFVFIHLYNANLIPDKLFQGTNLYVVGDQFPRLKAGSGGFVLTTYRDRFYYFLGLSHSFTDGHNALVDLSQNGIMTPATAFGIDSKLDDGIPSTGKVFAVTDGNASIDTTANACVATVAATNYNMDDRTERCRLFVGME
jgi:prepilin-type N-terminal cleavage/methylation domain-containing protein